MDKKIVEFTRQFDDGAQSYRYVQCAECQLFYLDNSFYGICNGCQTAKEGFFTLIQLLWRMPFAYIGLAIILISLILSGGNNDFTKFGFMFVAFQFGFAVLLAFFCKPKPRNI